MIADFPASHYFDTPERSERQQLLLHLVRNAGEVIYLRGPDGAGKTLFARRIFEQLGEGLYGAWIDAGREPDFVAAVNRQLSVATDSASPWPDSLVFALGERELLLVVDDADAIDTQTLSHIAALRQRGGHILLIGRGGLPPGSAVSPQFMDLPGFDAQQSAAFLRSRSTAAASTITDDVADALHRAAQGMPGPLVDALQVLATRPAVAQRPVGKPVPGRRPALMWYLLAGVVVLLLGTVLLFQDNINEAVAPDPPAVAVEIAPATDVSAPAAERSEINTSWSSPVPPVGADRVEVPPAPLIEPLVGTVANDDIDPLEAVMQDALAAQREASTQSAKTDPAAVPLLPPSEPVAPPPLPSPAATADASSTAPSVTEATAPAASESRVAVTAAADKAVERPTPAPVVDRRISAAGTVAAASAATEALPAPQPAPVVDRSRPQTRPARSAKPDWLQSRDPSHYTLQLVGARDRAAIEKFVRQHRIRQPYAVFERNLKGAPWYSLVAGDYPDRAAAVAARAALPAGLERSGVWPRSFASIYQLLK